MHDEVRRWAEAQEGLVARWQPDDEKDRRRRRIDWATRGFRPVFSGVYVTGWGPVTQSQLWRAATLTAPHTSLHVASAAGFWRFRADPGHFISVVRPGDRGVNRSGGLRVAYSSTLEGNTVVVDGISVTTPERTIIDLWPHLSPWERSKMLREALRLKRTTSVDLLAAVHDHRSRLGATSLRTEVQARIDLPFERCKSDAEAFGLVVLHDAGYEIPLVNTDVAGEEADFTFPGTRDIVEIDGPQWHRHKEEDARKTAIWVKAGFNVNRIPSGLVFAEPGELLRLCPPRR